MKDSVTARRSFLLWLSEGEGFAGRVEHLDSGRRARFESHEELDQFVFEVLGEEIPGNNSELEVIDPKGNE